jgi:hypothetical protein
MIKPVTDLQAREEVDIVMSYRLTGFKRKRKEALLLEYQSIISTFYKRWGVGLYQLTCGHILSYFTLYEDTRGHGKPRTRYRHWLRLKELMITLGVYDVWEPELRGSWRNPDGSAYVHENSNAGRKCKYK